MKARLNYDGSRMKLDEDTAEICTGTDMTLHISLPREGHLLVVYPGWQGLIDWVNTEVGNVLVLVIIKAATSSDSPSDLVNKDPD